MEINVFRGCAGFRSKMQEQLLACPWIDLLSPRRTSPFHKEVFGRSAKQIPLRLA
jgi:hypothetical protein